MKDPNISHRDNLYYVPSCKSMTEKTKLNVLKYKEMVIIIGKRKVIKS